MMTKATSTPKKSRKTKASARAAAPETQAPSKRPGGKLGQVVERLETSKGTTLAELTDLTGWQPHTVRAALTRLRQRGFKTCLEARNDRKAYRLDAGEG